MFDVPEVIDVVSEELALLEHDCTSCVVKVLESNPDGVNIILRSSHERGNFVLVYEWKLTFTKDGIASVVLWNFSEAFFNQIGTRIK